MAGKISGFGQSGVSGTVVEETAPEKGASPLQTHGANSSAMVSGVKMQTASEKLDEMYPQGLNSDLIAFASPGQFDAELRTPAGFSARLRQASGELEQFQQRTGSEKAGRALKVLRDDLDRKDSLQMLRDLLKRG